MPQDESKKKDKTKRSLPEDQRVAEVVKIMANTAPVSNEEIKKQKKLQK